YLVLLCYAVHPILPFNPISLPYEKGVSVALFVPEGWKFFTRNPQEALPLAFVRGGDGRWRPASPGPNAAPENRFGLSRAGRARGVETGLLLEGVQKGAWMDCKEAVG